MIHHLIEQPRPRALQPQARLRDDVRGESEVGIDAKGGLVEDMVRVGVAVAVVHLRLGGDGEELIRGAQEVGRGRREARPV